jgi:hypothetical protein
LFLIVLLCMGWTIWKTSGGLPRDKQIADRNAGRDNIQQLALAMNTFYYVNNCLPPSAITDRKTGKPLLSWRVLILPCIKQGDLYRRFHLDEPWDSPHNIKFLRSMPGVFTPGMHSNELESAQGGQCHFQVFVGPGTAFEPTNKAHPNFGREGLHLKGDFPDGTYRTLLIVEAAEAVPWTKPADLSYDPSQLLPKLGGTFESDFLAATADGKVRFIQRTISEQTLRALITRNAGDTPGNDW